MNDKRLIYIASDHAGFKLKNNLIKDFKNFVDLGCFDENSCDYPDFARNLCNKVREDENSLGILICGSGIGMSIAANRFKNIRAALVLNKEMAMLSRLHNNANVLVLGSRLTDYETSKLCVETFLKQEFEGGRHINRVNKLKDMGE